MKSYSKIYFYFFLNTRNSSVRASNLKKKNDFYLSKQTEIALDFFNPKSIFFKVETNTPLVSRKITLFLCPLHPRSRRTNIPYSWVAKAVKNQSTIISSQLLHPSKREIELGEIFKKTIK